MSKDQSALRRDQKNRRHCESPQPIHSRSHWQRSTRLAQIGGRAHADAHNESPSEFQSEESGTRIRRAPALLATDEAVRSGPRLFALASRCRFRSRARSPRKCTTPRGGPIATIGLHSGRLSLPWPCEALTPRLCLGGNSCHIEVAGKTSEASRLKVDISAFGHRQLVNDRPATPRQA